MAVVAHAVDDIGALLPLFDHLRHDFRRILQIGVETDHRVAAGQIVAAGQRHLVTEIARERDPGHARVRLGEVRNLRPGRVAATVVDQHELEGIPALQAVGQRGQFAPQARKDLRFVETRDHQRNQRPARLFHKQFTVSAITFSA